MVTLLLFGNNADHFGAALASPGHGVLPETSPDQVKFVVDRVHAGRG
jgi:uroporphyrinogen-III decarboxylase